MYGSQFRRNAEIPDGLRRRLRLVTIVSALILSGLFFRLWNLQIINGEKFRSLSENNRIAYRVVRSPRGLILDSAGRILADNRPSFNVYLIKEDAEDLKTTIRRLAAATSPTMSSARKSGAPARSAPF